MELLELDGWTRGRRTNHGVFFSIQFPGERMLRSTVIPDKPGSLPTGTLGGILGVKQSGLGRGGLQDLITRYHYMETNVSALAHPTIGAWLQANQEPTVMVPVGG